MRLLESDITKFQAIYETRFGISINRKTARTLLLKLVRQFEIVHRPLRKGQLERFIQDEDEKEDDNDNRVARISN